MPFNQSLLQKYNWFVFSCIFSFLHYRQWGNKHFVHIVYLCEQLNHHINNFDDFGQSLQYCKDSFIFWLKWKTIIMHVFVCIQPFLIAFGASQLYFTVTFSGYWRDKKPVRYTCTSTSLKDNTKFSSDKLNSCSLMYSCW